MRVFFQLGIRMMHVTYNRRNLLGDGCAEPANGGLSDLGRAAIAEMNRVGVIVDVAHSGWRTSLEAAKASQKPMVASHTVCDGAEPPHPRQAGRGHPGHLRHGRPDRHLLHPELPGRQRRHRGAAGPHRLRREALRRRPRGDRHRRGPHVAARLGPGSQGAQPRTAAARGSRRSGRRALAADTGRGPPAWPGPTGRCSPSAWCSAATRTRRSARSSAATCCGCAAMRSRSRCRLESALIKECVRAYTSSLMMPSASPPWKFSGSGTFMRSKMVLQRLPRRTSSFTRWPWCLTPRRAPPASIVGR